MPKAFVSYSTKDQKAAESLRTMLRYFGDDVFFAGDSIPAGKDGWCVIIDALTASDVVFFLATESSCQSKAVERELTEALKQQKIIYPFLWDIKPEQLPVSIRHLQAVDLRDVNQRDAFFTKFGQSVGTGNILLGIGIAVVAFVAGLLVVGLVSSGKNKT